MINNKRVLAIVPARGGSKGIPRKNIIDINGKPLIQYTLEEAKKSKYIDEIHISTDDREISEVVNKLGFEIKRLRPEILAKDNSKTIDVLKDVVNYYNSIGESFGIVILLQPTQPMRKVNHIDDALEKYIECGKQGIVSVNLVEQHPLLMREIDNQGKLKNLIDSNSTVRRQDFKQYYIVNGAIYINSVEDIVQEVSLNDNTIPFVMDECYVHIDIDELKDLEKFEFELKRKHS